MDPTVFRVCANFNGMFTGISSALFSHAMALILAFRKERLMYTPCILPAMAKRNNFQQNFTYQVW